MLPYAVGHANYARAASAFLVNTEIRTINVLKEFGDGKHVMRHMRKYYGTVFLGTCLLKLPSRDTDILKLVLLVLH